MAPEVMIKQNHTFTVDYYAIGIIAHEFMLGRRPYEGENKQEILEKIRTKQVEVTIP
jgi:serine/threonine protein kinase